jgi:hypothetical protein
MKKVFIGGSRKLWKINKDIQQRIDNIIKNGHKILIGDANGIDKSVQQYLFSKKYINVLVCCSGDKCRNNVGNWKVKYIETGGALKGRLFYTLKDIEMAKDTDFGMMIWDGKSVGTFNNIFNLMKLNKQILLYYSPKKVFYTIRNLSELESILPDRNEKRLFQDILPTPEEISASTKDF